ncbi:unnamed protein product [Cuscuta campestris]|uniref:Uncharacterized protein n=1 Tax=Cuscuta campestris TaxID=132261 RepID=A0A484MMQ9_9ASTE|nr:unnamed protein product [Cuscuta campestris]
MDENDCGSSMNTSDGRFKNSNGEDLSYKSSPEIDHDEMNDVKNNIGEEFRSIYEITSDEINHLEFDTLDQACNFYETYARCKGFAVRKDDVQRDVNNNIKMRQLVCNKAGLRDKKYLTMLDRKKPHRPITRTNCEARFRVHLDYKTSKWIVTSFVEHHNHFLCPSKYVHLFPAYRALNDADKAQIDILHAQGVRTCHIMGYMVAQKGGYDKVGFTKKDLYNYLDTQKHVKIEDGDARAALSYLQGKADNDPMLFCKYGVGTDGKLKHLFWADGASIVDFQCFGDVLAFDTTYKKNK